MTVAAAEMDNTEDDAYRTNINAVLLRIEVGLRVWFRCGVRVCVCVCVCVWFY